MKEKEKENLMFFIFALECKKFKSTYQIRDPKKKKKKKPTEHRGSVGEMWTCCVVNNATPKLLWFRA